ncbi:hypothetical protein NQ314_018014 [Rhamnusium bicolor]|uniref:NADH dehydrogenase [ubiquinone] 1 alpha subcomplex subunit 7 n=1 Tax=Rhamnusium bicolor TaxID=1586634 RepID=A0AAV8WU90_9CUCU|nr:hypothetical protein NQ314_018014 [Rhamnusium bicolor]
MPPKVQVHDVNPFFQAIRDFLLGRKHTLALRFPRCAGHKIPPPPVLPDGPSHKLSANYYYTRDARREVSPPEVLIPTARQIDAGDIVKSIKKITPGKVYKWD